MSFPERSPLLMSRERSGLLVIDVQSKLVPHIPRNSALVWNIGRLMRAASTLGVQFNITEQYPQGLGPSVPALARLLSELQSKTDDTASQVQEKRRFSCSECEAMLDALEKAGRRQLLLCGIETHVCVQQTALDLVSRGFDVFLAVDAIGSRNAADHQTALRRMESCGVHLLTVEAAIFEWCETSANENFKQISQLIQEKPPASFTEG